MDVLTGTLQYLDIYDKIYTKYIRKIYSELKNSEHDIECILAKIKEMERSKGVLSSPRCKVLILINNENDICGFMEANLVDNDYMFEKSHVYISNLYIDKKEIENVNIVEIVYNMYEMIVEWAKLKNVYYVCNDVNENNIIMKKLNEMLRFKPYKTRYFKEID